MNIELKRKPDASMAQVVTIRQHALVADVSAEEGGEDAGPSPHDLYDAALASCKALTVMWYARKKGIAVDEIKTVIKRDASQERTGIYRLDTTLQISGGFSDAQLQELSSVAQKCPVHKLMASVKTEITTNVERLA